MTTPPNAPEVDVRSILNRAAIQLELGHIGSMNLAIEVREALAAMLTRESALVARNAELEAALRDGWSEVSEQLAACREDWQRVCDAIEPGVQFDTDDVIGKVSERDALAAERDALAAEVGALRLDAERWREVERRFNESKTSAACLVLEGLGLEPTPYRDFAETVDAARAEAGHG